MPPAPSHQPAAEIPRDLLEPLPLIESRLADAVSSLEGPTALREAIAYATLGGGKRLRPLLAWHSCVAAGGRGPESLAAGVSLELVHCFSLVHDDLPALDDDDLRRGRPTLHRHAGEAMAILAGDALLSHAFCVLAAGVPGATAGRFVSELAQACEGMIAGQVLDTIGFGEEAHEPAPARLERIHRGKTGAMLRGAARMGAMSAERLTEDALSALTRFGEAVGLMFQIVDDVIDVTQDPAHAGKRTNKDSPAGKLTYPGVLGLEGARARIEELRAESEAAIDPLGAPAEPLRRLTRYLAGRTR